MACAGAPLLLSLLASFEYEGGEGGAGAHCTRSITALLVHLAWGAISLAVGDVGPERISRSIDWAQCYPTTSRRCSEVVGSIRTAEDLEAMASMLRAEKEDEVHSSGVTKRSFDLAFPHSQTEEGQLRSLPIKPTVKSVDGEMAAGRQADRQEGT